MVSVHLSASQTRVLDLDPLSGTLSLPELKAQGSQPLNEPLVAR